jgi:outer membrane lipoprotein SlyB
MNKIIAVLAVTLLTACVQKPGQDVYKAGEVGVSRAVEYGTVLEVRDVVIAADNKGAGTLLGAGAGAGGGSYVGNGSGSGWAMAGGAIAGAVIGNAIQEEIGKSSGYEYTLKTLDGDIKTIVQPHIEGDKVFKPGDKVRMETCDAGEHFKKCYPETKNRQYQRLLPVDKFPTMAAKTKKKNKIVLEVEAEPSAGGPQ